MTCPSTEARTTADNLPQQQIDFYQTNGFVKVEGIISPAEADRFREAALNISKISKSHTDDKVFDQHVNVWREHESIRPLTLHPNIAAIAQKLAGVPLRLWHDQILIKRPNNQTPTEFHQDQPYWPHTRSFQPISCWVALCDVPVERGCMTFLPESHSLTDLPPQNLHDSKSLLNMSPELCWSERVTVPLKAGDCTFHHGRCGHMATPNYTQDPRVAHVVIYVDESTVYDGRDHVVTDPLNLDPGSQLEGDLFPSVDQITASAAHQAR